MKEKFSLVIPTFNEAKNIENLCEQLLKILPAIGIDFEIIIVDDDSPDKTWMLAEALSRKNDTIKVIRRTKEKDLSTAVTAGWQVSSGNILGVIDADFQHPPDLIPLLAQEIIKDNGVDIVIASRYKEGGGVSVWSLTRKLVSRLGGLISNFLLPGILTRIHDPMSGFFVLRKRVIENRLLIPRGYKILLEVLAKGNYKNVIELPYIFQERKTGESKLSLKQYFNFLWHICKLSFQTKEFFRLIKYIIVGFIGAVVTVSLFYFGTKIGFSQPVAYIVALEIAIINNFLLNEFWTFKDKSRLWRDLKFRLLRFIKFNLICSSGAFLSFLTFFLFTKVFVFHAISGVLAGIIIAFIWNFLGSANITWFFKLYHRLEKEKELESGYYHRVLERNKIQHYWHTKKFAVISQKIDSSPILDVGSGPGVFFSLYRDYPGLKINLDYSYQQLKYSKDLNNDIACVAALADNLPFLNQSIANLCLIEVIEHLDDNQVRQCLYESFRVLKKKGKIIVSTPNYKSIWPVLEPLVSMIGQVDYQKQHITHFTMDKVINYLQDAGFRIERKETIFIIAPFFAFLGFGLANFLFNFENTVFPNYGSIIIVEAIKE